MTITSARSVARVRTPLLCAAAAGLVLVFASIARVAITETLRDTVSAQEKLLSLAAELRHSSDALTRWSRAYAVTRDPQYRQLFTELLEVREGRRGRPRGDAPIYWNLREWGSIAPDETAPPRAILDIVRSSGASPDQIALFDKAKDVSARLATVEARQMQAADAAGPELSPAVLLPLFDRDYVTNKGAVMLPIDQFSQSVYERTNAQTRNGFNYLRATDYILAAAALALLWSLLASWRGLRSLIGEPVAQFAARIRSLLPAGVTRTAREAACGDSLSCAVQSVASALETRDRDIQALIRKLTGEQERMHILIDNAPVAIALFDTQMRYLAWSKRWTRDYGLEGRELAGRSHYEIFPEIPDVWRKQHQQALAGESLRHDEDHFTRSNGHVQILRWQIEPWRDDDGSVGGILMMTEDVTRSVMQRDELHSWTRAFEEAEVGIAWIDPDVDGEPRIVNANPRLARMLGMAREELCGQLVWSIIPEDRQDAMLATVQELESAGHVSSESALLTRDGRHLPVLLDITNRTAQNTGKQLRVAFVLELSERQRLLADLESSVAELQSTNQRLRQARDEAMAASSTRHAILANMSHELRTPLNHILGFAHLLESMPLDAKARERAQRINAAAGKLLHLVNNLLDAVRVETGTLALEDEDFNLRVLLDTLTGDLEPMLGAGEKRIVMALQQEVPERLRGDPRHLMQALRELLENALKFSQQGVVLHVSEPQASDGKRRLRIEVEDRGIGVSAEQQRTLFSWFAQGDDSATRSYGGVGMGLALAQRVVALMNGTMGYRATPGGGSTFWLELPLREARASGTGTAAPDPAAARTWLGEWLPMLSAQDMNAISHWDCRPDSVTAALASHAGLLDSAVRAFDLELARELAEHALTTLPPLTSRPANRPRPLSLAG